MPTLHAADTGVALKKTNFVFLILNQLIGSSRIQTIGFQSETWN